MNEEKQVKKLLARLREDKRGLLQTNQNVTNILVKKLKYSTYPKDSTFLSLYFNLKNENKNPEEK